MRLDEVVLDTTVASFMLEDDTRLGRYEEQLSGKTVAFPFQTMDEMRLGARLAGWGKKRSRALESFFGEGVSVPHDWRVSAAWVTLMEQATRIGRRLEVADAWIAACALRRGSLLLTHDPDFVNLGVPGLFVFCRAEDGDGEGEKA